MLIRPYEKDLGDSRPGKPSPRRALSFLPILMVFVFFFFSCTRTGFEPIDEIGDWGTGTADGGDNQEPATVESGDDHAGPESDIGNETGGDPAVAVCPNGIAEGSEQCDRLDVRGLDCSIIGLPGGTLGCTDGCRFDFSGCNACGNDRIDGTEACDGSDLRGETCSSQGFTTGELGCDGSCRYDFSGCVHSMPGELRLFYGRKGVDELDIRIFDTSAGEWIPGEVKLTTTGSVRWVINKISPVSNDDEVAIALTETPTDTRLYLLHWSSATAWIMEEIPSAIPILDINQRGFDLEYESLSGKALVVYSDNTANPLYRTWDGVSWSSPNPVFTAPPATGIVAWVELVSRRNQDEITLLYSDMDFYLHAVVWDGSQWRTDSIFTFAGTIESNSWQVFDGAYEWNRDNFMMAYAPVGWPPTCGAMRLPDSDVWSESVGCPMGEEGGPLLMKSERMTDRVVVIKGNPHLHYTLWDGTEWYNSGYYIWNTAAADVAWVGTTGTIIMVRGYPDPVESLKWVRWDSSLDWVEQTPFPMEGLGDLTHVKLQTLPAEDKVMAIFADTNGNLFAATFDNGSGWGITNSGQPLVTGDLASATTQPFNFDIKQ